MVHSLYPTMFYQVNKIVFKRNILRPFLRFTHDLSASKTIYPLESRRLLRVAGTDAGTFLQGLITNDMRHFDDGAKSMYAMFLNNKGRILYDTLIHRYGNEQCYMLECDKNIIGELQKHLKLFKLRRKVEIDAVSPNYKIWAFVALPNTLPETYEADNDIYIYKDPRLADLGFRIITSSVVKENHISELVGEDSIIEKSENGYKYLRYTLGVSEGSEDLPPGTGFPLEANCDYLHGVSFHKGCYIGQEVTARVHHTGVVRKRIMPLKFNENIGELKIDSVISASDKPKSNLGKLKGFINDVGIGLVRIKEALDAKSLVVGDKQSVEVIKPSWWPKEAPKEKATLNKLET